MTLPYDPVPPPPSFGSSFAAWQGWALQLVGVVGGMLSGKLNATGQVTPEAGSPVTTIIDARISPTSVITFMPLTPDAAAEITAGLYVSMQTAGSATITHT